MNRRMEPTDDTALDRIVTRWMHDEAPPQAPDRLVDDVRVAASSMPQRSGGRSTHVVLAVLAAAILVLAIFTATQVPGILDGVGTGPSPTASPSAPPTATPSVTPTPIPTATGMPTGPGDALMSFIAPCDVVPPILVPATTILEDGRVVWRSDDGAYSVRQLSAVGLARLHDVIDESGLFESSATYTLVRRQGAPEPPGHGICTWGFSWSDGDAPTVAVQSVNWLGDEEEATYYELAPERHALHILALQLMDPEAWFADDADWRQPESAPFTPDRYLIRATVSVPQLATEGAPDFDTVSWPLDATPDASQGCGEADATAVEQLAAELAEGGLEQFTVQISGAAVTLPWAAQNASVDLSIWFQMPDGNPACDV